MVLVVLVASTPPSSVSNVPRGASSGDGVGVGRRTGLLVSLGAAVLLSPLTVPLLLVLLARRLFKMAAGSAVQPCCSEVTVPLASTRTEPHSRRGAAAASPLLLLLLPVVALLVVFAAVADAVCCVERRRRPAAEHDCNDLPLPTWLYDVRGHRSGGRRTTGSPLVS